MSDSSSSSSHSSDDEQEFQGEGGVESYVLLFFLGFTFLMALNSYSWHWSPLFVSLICLAIVHTFPQSENAYSFIIFTSSFLSFGSFFFLSLIFVKSISNFHTVAPCSFAHQEGWVLFWWWRWFERWLWWWDRSAQSQSQANVLYRQLLSLIALYSSISSFLFFFLLSSSSKSHLPILTLFPRILKLSALALIRARTTPQRWMRWS